MKKQTTRLLALLLCLCMVPAWFPVPAAAEETEPTMPPAETEAPAEAEGEPLAQDVSSRDCVTEAVGIPYLNSLFDGDIYAGWPGAEQASITLSHEAGIGSLYIIFQQAYGVYILRDEISGEVYTCGEYGFMHEFIDVEAAFGYAPTTVTLFFDNGPVAMNEIMIFTPGPVPETVQKWEPQQEDTTDMILFSTHGDDEQLFFAGLLPYYAGERDYTVQVVYLTDHQNQSGTRRMREMLAGLWAVGVKIYPVFGYFEDFKTLDRQAAYDVFEDYGHDVEELRGFVLEQLRRFKPKVVVGHDFKGEYNHGQHIVYAEMLAEALEISNDPTQYPELAEKYGVWDVPKAYFHLYEENPIVMDWDQPLEAFDGLTAFQVTQEYGFPCHKSQHRSWFYLWIYGDYGEITKASEITEYSPCEYGLYRSLVGPDVQKNDFFENVTTHAEDAALEAERAEQERLEQERLEAERAEQERLEQERQEAERLEQERLEQEQREKEEAEKQAAEAEAKKQREEEANRVREQKILVIALSGMAVLVVLLVILLLVLKRKKR